MAVDDRIVLDALFENGASTAREIMESIEIDQFEMPQAEAWIEHALEHGLIEEAGGSGASTRFNITDKGRDLIGKPSGR